jgi:hypothetical protein
VLSKIKLAAVILASALTLGVAATASAAPTVTTGPGAAAVEQCHGYLVDAGPKTKLRQKAGFRTEFLGTIKLAGQCGVCIDYGLQGPDGRWGTGSVAPIKDRAVRERVAWLANAYWADASTSDRQAAALKVAINRLTSADFRADWAGYAKQLKGRDPGVAPRSDEMLQASLAAGPVKVTATVAAKPKPGGTGVVEVKALGNGRPLAGQPIRWTVTGARTVSSSATTRSDGTASMRLAWDGAKALQVSADVTSPEWRKAIYSTPTTGKRQHLVRGSISVMSTARVGYDATLGATITQDCSTTCDGRPPVTLAAEAGATDTQWRLNDLADHGKQLATLDVKAGTKGSKTFTGADGQKLQPYYRVRVGKGWSAWRAAGKPFNVVCPPWPAISLDCACSGVLTVTLTPPAGKRFYSASVGSKTGPINGRTTLTAPLKTGESAAITVTAYSDAKRTKPIGTHTYGTWSQG